MLSVVLSEGGLRCLAASEITSAVLLRPRLALRRLMPWSSANVALSREFPDILVLLMLLWSILGRLLAIALWLRGVEARLLRLHYMVAVAPRLPPVARWITASSVG